MNPPPSGVGSVNGRLELICQYKNSFKRLDVMNNEIREKILRASTNAELDIFLTNTGNFFDNIAAICYNGQEI